MKPYDLGLVVGRFQNFHLGHARIIDTASLLCDRVLVLVGSAQEYGTEKNPFNSATRISIVKEIYEGSNIEVKAINDTLLPSDDWGEWLLANCMRYHAKAPDLIVFGSDIVKATSWFTEEQMSYTSQLIISRATIPISGTQARQLLLEDNQVKWNTITPPKMHKHYHELRAELLSVY